MTCTSCQVLLGTQEEYKAHYKSEFHTYNLKRKTVSLPPVDFEVFAQKKRDSESLTTSVSSGVCDVCGTSYASASAFQHHLNSKKHKDTAEAKANRVSKPVPTEVTLDPLLSCLICNQQAASIDANLTHMLNSHGFFLPDVYKIVDLEGLLKYLFEKVHVGNMCLYCNNKRAHAFSTAAATQQHMTDKQHCFLNIDEDVEEFSPFYDFSDVEDSGSEDEADLEGEESKEMGESSSAAASSRVSVPRSAQIPGEITPTGELKLPNGKLLGHKDYVRYYKQKYRGSYIRHQEVLALMADAYQGQVQVLMHWKLTENMIAAKIENKARLGEAMKIGVLGNSLQKHFRKSHP